MRKFSRDIKENLYKLLSVPEETKTIVIEINHDEDEIDVCCYKGIEDSEGKINLIKTGFAKKWTRYFSDDYKEKFDRGFGVRNSKLGEVA